MCVFEDRMCVWLRADAVRERKESVSHCAREICFRTNLTTRSLTWSVCIHAKYSGPYTPHVPTEKSKLSQSTQVRSSQAQNASMLRPSYCMIHELLAKPPKSSQTKQLTLLNLYCDLTVCRTGVKNRHEYRP